MNESRHPNLPEDQLPQEVVAALRERHGPEIDVPEAVHAAVLADAKQHLNTIPRPISVKPRSRKWAWVAWSTGTLAAAMLLFAVLPPGQNDAPNMNSFADRDSTESMAPEQSYAFEEAGASAALAAAASGLESDVDGNGQVDILDAFALARTVNSGTADVSRWDLNGDGRMNQDDVRLVALQAVML